MYDTILFYLFHFISIIFRFFFCVFFLFIYNANPDTVGLSQTNKLLAKFMCKTHYSVLLNMSPQNAIKFFYDIMDVMEIICVCIPS